jgi:hypothetical protein
MARLGVKFNLILFDSMLTSQISRKKKVLELCLDGLEKIFK